MNRIVTLTKTVIGSHKTTLLAMFGAALTAAIPMLISEHFEWRLVLAAALTVLAGYSKSPATPKEDPPTPGQ